MFGDYFQGQTYKFDVMNTITRTASSLLQRGIRVIQAETAHTDGKTFIALPQAMKRYLTWDEIDFVRYLLHHEVAYQAQRQYDRLCIQVGVQHLQRARRHSHRGDREGPTCWFEFDHRPWPVDRPWCLGQGSRKLFC